MCSKYLGVAVGLLCASASPAAVTIHTSAFISAPVGTNDVEGLSADLPVNSAYTQGGVTIEYVTADPVESAPGAAYYAGPGFPDLGGGTQGAYAIGYHGYASIKLASGDTFNQIQFLTATGGNSELLFDLRLGGVSVGTGVAGLLSNDWTAPLYYGFSGATFDEVRLRTGYASPGAEEFYGSAVQDTLVLDNIAIGNEASAAPEPSTWAMMIVGFAAVGCSMRTRKTRIAFA